MRGRKCILVLLLCMMCGSAAAETHYRTLCDQHNLDAMNVIAWLEIPETAIHEPIMRHLSDDTYYATHDALGMESVSGSVYVQQKYNSDDFTDPVTLVYGSSASEAAPFGKLQEMYSGDFERHKKVYVHLPEESCEYVVFAALPYSAIHILHYYDFKVERRYNSFFDIVFSTKVLGMHLDKENRPEFGKDRVLILSTGLRGDPLQRYLVMARKVPNDM